MPERFTARGYDTTGSPAIPRAGAISVRKLHRFARSRIQWSARRETSILRFRYLCYPLLWKNIR